MDGRSAATVGQRVRALRLIPPPAAPATPGSDRPRLLPTTFAPFTGEPLAELTLTAPAGVGAAFDAAREAQRQWAARPLPERAAVFLRFHDLVLARQAEVLDLIQLETGKARKHAFEEVADVAIVSRHYARAARQYLGP